MITIISGVPGTGKTGLVVDMIMDQLRDGRKVFTSGIPDLLLDVQKAGDLHEWQKGNWLKIAHYNPELTKAKGIESSWFPRDCPTNCEFLSTCPNKFNKGTPDGGALIIVDEAHIHFPQRASGKAPPEYIEAFNVHRHQGLDFWFLTQRPSFLDPFIRGLCSQHIHLQLDAFSFTGSRNKYQWSEYQETVNKSSKLLASKSSYKPMPHVFPLYASATVHTKLDQAMPNIMKAFIVVIVILLLMVGLVVKRANDRIESINKAQEPLTAAQSSKPITKPPAQLVSAGGGGGTTPPDAGNSVVGGEGEKAWPFPVVDACATAGDYCRCYRAGVRVPMDDMTCKAIVVGGWIKPRQEQNQFNYVSPPPVQANL